MPEGRAFVSRRFYQRYQWQTAEGTPVSHSFTILRTGVQASAILQPKTEIPYMTLLDVFVDANFTSEQAGRVVIFPWGRRNKGYVVKSESEELRIRSFLKMFYFAQLSIQLLGLLLALEWSREFSYALGRPLAFLFRVSTTLLFYCFVVGIPYLLLWRSYKKALVSFVSVQDEVAISGKRANRHWIVIAGLVALGLLVLFGVMLLTRGTSVAN